MSWVAGSRKAGFRCFWEQPGKSPDGKRRSPKASTTFATKGEAEEFKREYDKTHLPSRLVNGILLATSPIGAALQRFTERGCVNGNASPEYRKEVEDYINGMAKLMEWTTIGEITYDAVDRWKARKNGKGVHKPLSILRGFLGYCKKINIAVDQTVIDIELPDVVEGEDPELMPDALAKIAILACYAQRFSVGVGMEHMALYACRPADIRRADVRDWDAVNRVVTVRKSKGKRGKSIKKRVHESHAKKLDQLVEGRGPDEPLFLDPWGRRWSVSAHGCTGISSWYRHHIGRHFLPKNKEFWGVYHLKRYAITRLEIAAGGDSRAAMTISGHSTVQSFQRYNVTHKAAQDALLDRVAIDGDIAAIGTPEDAAKVITDKSGVIARKRLPKGLNPGQRAYVLHTEEVISTAQERN